MNIYLKNKEADSMIVNFEGLVSHIYKDVTVNDVLKEAIMNSIHANATTIDIDLQYEYEKNLVDKGSLGKLLKIIIKDNGDGFTEENINSFLEIYTKHKINIGGKGIGRISYLRLANIVKIISISKEKKKVIFDFNTELNKDKISYIDTDENLSTSIELSNLNLKTSTTYAQACLKTIQEHFNLLLFLRLKDLNQAITINLSVNSNLYGSVCSNDINCIDETIYKSSNVDFNIYTFKKENETGIKLFYCANHIQIEKIDLADKFYKQYSFAITSEFFDKYANEERTLLNLPKDETLDQKELLSDLPEKNYKAELRKKCLEIVLQHEPDTKQRNQEKINNIKAKYGYINLSDIDIEDLNLNEKEIVNKYRDNLNKKEDRLISLLNSQSSISVEDLAKEVSEQNKHELAKYIFHRDFILKKIESLIENKSRLEKDFHDLLFGKYSNNIWSIDDKFMSYTEAFSDEKISTIKKQIYDNYKKTNGDLKEPDITLLYSNETKDGYKDAVVCELKAFDISSDRKLVSITELNRNLGYIVKGIDNINNVWGYIITTLDESTQEELSMQQGVSQIFTNGMTPVYYYYNGNIEDINKRKVPCHVYIISPESLVKDARERNKTFLDILTKN
jgi:hypothetical protein